MLAGSLIKVSDCVIIRVLPYKLIIILTRLYLIRFVFVYTCCTASASSPSILPPSSFSQHPLSHSPNFSAAIHVVYPIALFATPSFRPQTTLQSARTRVGRCRLCDVDVKHFHAQQPAVCCLHVCHQQSSLYGGITLDSFYTPRSALRCGHVRPIMTAPPAQRLQSSVELLCAVASCCPVLAPCPTY